MIGMNNVSFSYNGRRVLDNFSFSVVKGEAVCITGPSGSGKSTVLRLLCGLEKPDSGNVFCEGKLSVVFQEDRLLFHYGASDNICKTAGCSGKESEALLEKLGLKETEDKKVSAFSGGMKRRLAFARAVAFGGDVLILDEAFNGIDESNKKIMADIIRKEFLEKEKYVIMVSHNKEDAEMLDARIINIKTAED